MLPKAGYILSILVVSIFLNCGNTNEFYTVDIVDDVRIIHNIKPLWGDDPKIELEFVKQIGDFDAVDENYMLFKPADIHIDEDDNYYVLDLGNHRVQKYGPDGIFITTIGRQGQGPGELSSPFGISGDKDGNILVIDPGNNRIQKYSPDGKDLGSTRMPAGRPFIQYLSTGDLVLQN